MSLEELTSRDAVLRAIEEFDRVGRDAFLEQYGYSRSRRYRIVHDGRQYDLKAIAGAAHGFQFPERGPLPRGSFGSGRRSTVPKLESLGFEVRSTDQADTTATDQPPPGRVWLVRAGKKGEYESLALDEGVALIGWSELEDVGSASREQLKEKIRRRYGEERPQSLASQAGEVYRFVHELRAGELVVLPLRSDPGHVAVGRIAGEYRHRTEPRWGPDARNTRAVDWIARRVPYQGFDPDLRQAFGQQGTVSEISKPGSADRILAVATDGGQRPPVHLVLKWSAKLNPETIELHREVAEGAHGAVWWGRVTKDPTRPGIAAKRLDALRQQLERGEETLVFLHGPSTWRTRLLGITLDEAEVDHDLVPDYYNQETPHSLWVKLADFEQIDPAELTRDYVLASSGKPVDQGSLGNQGPLFVRRRGAPPPPSPAAAAFDVDAVRRRAEEAGLRLPDGLYRQLLAALRSGKHVILTGPPGTAKTTLAQAVAETAAVAGECSGFLPTTATADWTTFETIGGLKPTKEQTLEFQPGHFMQAIENGEWLLIDELNRSNFDRAFGQLFTVLSGQPVVLPYARGDGRAGPVVLVPEGSSSPLETGDVLPIPRSWRIVATMNVFDKSLLFEMSFALMRRFAFVEVASPEENVFAELIEGEAGGDSKAAELTGRLLALRRLKDLGPAVYMDVARYLRYRRELDPAEDDGRLLFDAFYGYLLPQFEGIETREGEELFGLIGPLVGSAELRDRLRGTLNAVLGLDLQAAASGAEGDREDR